MIKVDIVSGFLGAGKTTLIKKIFESKKLKEEKVVIIENEFGEIGIDGTFLKDSGINIKEINAGCICCSLVGDFESSIKELNDTYHPDRIIIEPSGVGKLSDIINAVNKVDLEMEINILCTVVDASKVKMYLKNFGEFFNNQVSAASTIVVGKVDKCSEDKLLESVNLIKEVNPNANIITTNLVELDAEKLIQALEMKSSFKDELLKELKHAHGEECDDPDCECHHHDHEHHHHHHHHGHDADEVFVSWGEETVKSFSYDKLKSFLDALCNESNNLGIILRSKGVLKASDNDRWYYFDLVYGEYEIRLGEPDVTGRVVVIGSKLNEDAIDELFER